MDLNMINLDINDVIPRIYLKRGNTSRPTHKQHLFIVYEAMPNLGIRVTQDTQVWRMLRRYDNFLWMQHNYLQKSEWGYYSDD